MMKTCRIQRQIPRRGVMVVLAAAMLVMIFAFVAFTVDLGYICLEQGRCQNAADAASHAAASSLLTDREDIAAARLVAISYAEMNIPNSGNVLLEADVTFGVWDRDTHLFVPNNAAPNAVRTIVRRSEANGNLLRLSFAPIIGHNRASVSATAIAAIRPSSVEFRFLLDDEFIDSDIPTIQNLASSRGISSDYLISDRNGDGFIDLPTGAQLELPTGQVGDEGLFDRTSYSGAFPFQSESTYTTLDFLAEGTALQSLEGTRRLQDVEWTGGTAPQSDLVGKKVLDPVTGFDPMQNHYDILDLPDPDAIYVSPLFKSDVSMAERNPSKYGSPAANVQGERRGLLVFKIISARLSPSGGSYLPLITIEVMAPSTVDTGKLGQSSGSATIVK